MRNRRINMKKTLCLLSALTAAALALAGCEKKAVDETSSALPVNETTSAADTAGDTNAEPDPLAPTEESTEAENEPVVNGVSTVVTDGGALSTTTTDSAEQPDPLGGGAFQYDANGAVVFNEDYTTQSDSVLMAAAQALYESACQTQWNFTVGCPYSVDMDNYIENEFGWQFHLINDGVTTSLADVESDYYKVFSDRYPNPLSEVYCDGADGVYALGAERGMNIFYAYSQVTSIDSRSGDEIFFTVVSHYDGSDRTGEAYDESQTFSAVIGEDGVWRAGQFTLPY